MEMNTDEALREWLSASTQVMQKLAEMHEKMAPLLIARRSEGQETANAVNESVDLLDFDADVFAIPRPATDISLNDSGLDLLDVNHEFQDVHECQFVTLKIP